MKTHEQKSQEVSLRPSFSKCVTRRQIHTKLETKTQHRERSTENFLCPTDNKQRRTPSRNEQRQTQLPLRSAQQTWRWRKPRAALPIPPQRATASSSSSSRHLLLIRASGATAPACCCGTRIVHLGESATRRIRRVNRAVGVTSVRAWLLPLLLRACCRGCVCTLESI